MIEGSYSPKSKRWRDRITHVSQVYTATYYRVKEDLKSRRTWLRKTRTDYKSILKKEDKLSIYQTIVNNPFLSCRDLVKVCKLSVSYKTVERYFKQSGFARKKPHGQIFLKITILKLLVSDCISTLIIAFVSDFSLKS